MRNQIIIIFTALLLQIFDIKAEVINNIPELDSISFLLINKTELVLSVVNESGNITKQYNIACAVNYGNKKKKGDHKTPEGLFHINQILKSSNWTHDFGDGKGPVANAYGPWFFRLDVPSFIDIGIHGTHLPESIGSRCTEGCIRLKNDDVEELKSIVYLGMPVLILPDSLCNGDSTIVLKYKANQQDSTIIKDTPTVSPQNSENNKSHLELWWLIAIFIALIVPIFLIIRHDKKPARK